MTVAQDAGKPEDRPGRELEKIVADLERATQGRDVSIKSPDFAEDKTTGKKREIDVGVRFKAGEYDILIAIQCRDRGKVQGPDWIEELHGWGRDIGANVVVAVCTAGFSDAALEKAKFHGIQTKTVTKVTSKEFKEWKRQALTLDITSWRSKSIQAMFPANDAQSIAMFAKYAPALLARDKEETVIAIEVASGKQVTPHSLMRSWAKGEGTKIIEDLRKNEEWKAFTIHFRFRTPHVAALPDARPPIEGFVFPVELYRAAVEMPATGLAYKDEQTRKAHVHSQWTIDVNELFPKGHGVMLRILFNGKDITQD